MGGGGGGGGSDDLLPCGPDPVGLMVDLTPAGGGGGGGRGTLSGDITVEDVDVGPGADAEEGEMGLIAPGGGGVGFVTVELADPGIMTVLLPAGAFGPPDCDWEA